MKLTENNSRILKMIKISIKRDIKSYDSICRIFNSKELFLMKSKNIKTILVLYGYV